MNIYRRKSGLVDVFREIGMGTQRRRLNEKVACDGLQVSQAAKPWYSVSLEDLS